MLHDLARCGMIIEPNNPDAVNPAIAHWLTIEDQWRRIGDLERYA
jgi:hypothetical protein